MHLLKYRVIPGANHPERAWLGEGVVRCWVNRRAIAGADTIARRAIRREKWQILERESAEVVTEADGGSDEEWLRRYHQAQAEGEAYFYHLSPRCPVYWVAATVARADRRRTAEAHYLLWWEAISAPGGEDVDEPDFWAGERGRAALDAGFAAMREAGWAVTSVVRKQPCARDDVPEELLPYYNEVADAGACLVFFHEGAPDEDAPNEVR